MSIEFRLFIYRLKGGRGRRRYQHTQKEHQEAKRGSPGGAGGEEPACPRRRRKTRVWSLGGEDRLEEGMAIQSRILARRIPWTEEPAGLRSTGLQRVGHGWSNLATCTQEAKLINDPHLLSGIIDIAAAAMQSYCWVTLHASSHLNTAWRQLSDAMLRCLL